MGRREKEREGISSTYSGDYNGIWKKIKILSIFNKTSCFDLNKFNADD
jgi:hypothetical protein